MNKGKWLFFHGLVLLLVLGCSGEDDISLSDPEPQLTAIHVSETELVLPPGGSVSVSFTVNTPSYAFNYTVSSSDCQVRLMQAGGVVPVGFMLTEIIPGEVKGAYSATLTDTGTGAVYEQQVCLAIAERNPDTGAESLVSSSYFTVRSEKKYAELTLDTGLPVVYVETEERKEVVSKTDYLPATLYIRGTEKYDDTQPLPCEVRGRGNTTWSWPKKPYLIRLETREPLLGMPKHKRWVLLANFMDRTLMRNLVSMKVSSMTSLAWTPSCVPVELVLNGKHRGSYLLIEQVRVDENRVAVAEMTPEDNAGDAVTGGYLLELDFHFDNQVQWIDPHGRNGQWGNGIPFAVKYPDPDDLTPQQEAYIKKYVSAAASVLYGENFKDPEKGYAAYLDVDSFIDYWIVFEVMGNHELGNPGSVFLHKDRGGKLVAGPCWDFDWGVLSYATSPQARTGLVNGKAIWYGRLFQDPAFKARVKARFEELLPQLETIPDYIDACEEMLEASARLNFAMWNPAEDASQNGGWIINGDERMSFTSAVARLKSIYRDRLRVIPENL